MAGESLLCARHPSLQSSVSAVTRPTHFNFYHSGALVTYNDITPDLPQAAPGDPPLIWPLIGQLVLTLASDWLSSSHASSQAPCHRVTVSSGLRVTNINLVMSELTLFETDLHSRVGH